MIQLLFLKRQPAASDTQSDLGFPPPGCAPLVGPFVNDWPITWVIRLPQSKLRRFLGASMNRFEAKDGDIGGLTNEMFGTAVAGDQGREYVTVKTPRGILECEEFVLSSEVSDD